MELVRKLWLRASVTEAGDSERLLPMLQKQYCVLGPKALDGAARLVSLRR